MIPENTILGEVEQQEHEDLTYRLDLKNKRITKLIDGLEATIQAMLKIILTERYSSVIYSSAYGSEIEPLIGADIKLVQADIQRRLVDALSEDSRFVAITNFNSRIVGFNELEVTFLLETIYGTETVQQTLLL